MFQYLPYNRIAMLRLSFTSRYTIDDPFWFHDMNFVHVSSSEELVRLRSTQTTRCHYVCTSRLGLPALPI